MSSLLPIPTLKRLGIVLVILALAALTAIQLVPNRAGADPHPDFEAVTAVPGEDPAAWQTQVEDGLDFLNANKANDAQVAAVDLGLPAGTQIQAFEVEAETTGGGPTATGRLSVEYPEPFTNDPSKVIVGIDLVRNVDNQNNFPVISQATEQSPTGFNVRLLNKEIEGIDSEVVRFQVTAIALP